jgi:hypothetical protein
LYDAAEGFHQIGQALDPRRVTWGTEQGVLIEEDGLRPLPKALLHEALRIRVPIVRDDYVSLAVARRAVDILPRGKLDLISFLPLEVREKVVIEAAILRSHDRGKAYEGSRCSGPSDGRALRLTTGALATGHQCSTHGHGASRAPEELQEVAPAHSARFAARGVLGR